MIGTPRKEGRWVGGAFVLLGILSLWEGRRLYALRTQMVAGAVVGDDTFPMIVGATMLLLGAGILDLLRGQVAAGEGRPGVRGAPHADDPGDGRPGGLLGDPSLPRLHGKHRPRLHRLFRAMGGYRWPLALLFGGVTTVLLYLLFRVWLLQPLPTGLLGL